MAADPRSNSTVFDKPSTAKSIGWNNTEAAQIVQDVRSVMGITAVGQAAAVSSLNDALETMQKIAQSLKAADYTQMHPEKAAKTISYLAKMVDEVVRLMEFAKGNPDSRPDIGLSDFLKFLTDDQFHQLNDWIAAGKAKVING